MKTENAIKQARQKVEAGLLAEDAYCVALTKSKHNSTPKTCELLENADKTYKAARRAVVALYKRHGIQVPKMKTIFMVENAFNNLIKLIKL